MKYLQSLTNLQAFQSFRKTSLAFTGSICTLGGLVADVLQPIAPFIDYLFYASFLAMIVVAILYFKGKRDLIGAFLLTGALAAVSGLFTLLQSGDEAEEIGVVASVVPPVAQLQETLGMIEEKIDSIKEDTEEIKAATNRIESQSEAMADSLSAIADRIENVSGDGIIASPASPEDHYHNARIHELEGDYSAARRAYIAYFKSDEPKLDPHLRFIAFLKTQEGTSGARETYNEIAYQNPSEAANFAKLLLLNTDTRIQKLTDYYESHSNFAPAAYHLSLEYSERRLGAQTLADKRRELRYLNAFVDADASGGLLRHLIDQELAAEWREDVNTRLNRLQTGPSAAALSNPVSLSWMAHNAGWNGNVQILEPHREIKWNIQGEGPPRSTGQSAYVDPQTGQPAPVTFFTLPRNQKDATVEIHYTDTSGQEHGPFAFEFKSKSESDDGNQRILAMTETSWLSFREYEGNLLVYFSHLLSYRGAIETIQYGIDTETPDQTLEFAPYDGPGIAPIDATLPLYQILPANTAYMTVQLTYKSGEQSRVVRIDR